MSRLPRLPPAAAPAQRGAPPAGARDARHGRAAVQPLFVVPGHAASSGRSTSMPGIAQLSVDRAAEECRRLGDARRARACCSSASPSHEGRARQRPRSTPTASCRARSRPSAARRPGSLLITDVCLCEYTDHGHCGVLRDERRRQRPDARRCSPRRRWRTRAPAPTSSRPSDMMDGRVGAIRSALDATGFADLPDHVLRREVRLRRSTARSARRPNRRRSSATGGATRWTRRTATRRCARSRSTSRKGADMVMVKPALPYLDVIRRVKERFGWPGGRLPRERRVRDDQGRRRARLDRRGARRRRRR